jgi:hypothetical protein
MSAGAAAAAFSRYSRVAVRGLLLPSGGIIGSSSGRPVATATAQSYGGRGISAVSRHSFTEGKVLCSRVIGKFF